MSISDERKEELRNQYVDLIVYGGYDDETHKQVDFWLDILDRELEEQRKRIVGEIGSYLDEYVEGDVYTDSTRDGILNLPSLAAGQVEEVRAVDSQWDGEGGEPLGRFITGQRHYNTDNEEKNGTAE